MIFRDAGQQRCDSLGLCYVYGKDKQVRDVLKPFCSIDGVDVYRADCKDLLRSLGDSTVDLIVTDPPYFKVKDCEWDWQWDDQSQFIGWIGGLCDEWQRVLKPNGSLYVFASSAMSWHVEGEVRKRFNVLTNIRWAKRGISQRQCKEELRAPFPDSETIIFAEHFGADNIAKGEAGYVARCDELRGFVFEPLRAYLASEWERAGLTAKDLNAATNSQMAGHYLTQIQWALPTEQKYQQMRDYANRNGGQYLRREYEELRREYEELRRPYFVTSSVPFTDVWEFPPVMAYDGKHPCEKPLAMMEHIIMSSSREGATILDCFAGSGVVGRAARNFGRKAILCEADSKWCDRIKRSLRQQILF